MSLPVVYRRTVGRDLASAFVYYEEQEFGLGEKFLVAVNSSFDAIEQHPQMFAQVHGEVRRAVVSRFPYAVYYRLGTDRIEVVAVFHCHRDPEGLMTRA